MTREPGRVFVGAGATGLRIGSNSTTRLTNDTMHVSMSVMRATLDSEILVPQASFIGGRGGSASGCGGDGDFSGCGGVRGGGGGEQQVPQVPPQLGHSTQYPLLFGVQWESERPWMRMSVRA